MVANGHRMLGVIVVRHQRWCMPAGQSAAIHDLAVDFASFHAINTIDNPYCVPGTLTSCCPLGSVVAVRADLAAGPVVAGTGVVHRTRCLVGLGGPDTFTPGHIAHPGDIAPCIFEGCYRCADGTPRGGRVLRYLDRGAFDRWARGRGSAHPGIRQPRGPPHFVSRYRSLTGRVDARLSLPLPLRPRRRPPWMPRRDLPPAVRGATAHWPRSTASRRPRCHNHRRDPCAGQRGRRTAQNPTSSYDRKDDDFRDDQGHAQNEEAGRPLVPARAARATSASLRRARARPGHSMLSDLATGGASSPRPARTARSRLSAMTGLTINENPVMHRRLQ